MRQIQKGHSPVEADVVLIGGGIMSATLGSMLAIVQPEWKVVLLERATELASESSGSWNNAGTGHSGYCELNYMPDATDGAKPADIAQRFLQSREWWAYLADRGLLDPRSFIHPTPHLNVVFGDRDIDYLRQRFRTLTADPLFSGMEFSDEPSTIAAWAPLVMAGRPAGERMAATRIGNGTDIDFASLAKGMAKMISSTGGEIRCGHEVRTLKRDDVGNWIVSGRNADRHFQVRAQHVFVGAGGYALRLLQKARIDEVRGYAVMPLGAAFLRCSSPDVVARHDGKIYGQAGIAAPPMSVPHLDKRVINGTGHLMFGPYATFSTKLLKRGRLTDFFATLRWNNIHVVAAAAIQNVGLLGYLVSQLIASHRSKVEELRRFYPDVNPAEWELVQAGQRAQLVIPDPRRIGVLQQGTELVTSTDGSIAGLLGASPGASTAVPTMLDLLERCFPAQWHNEWQAVLHAAVPARTAQSSGDSVERSLQHTAKALGLNA